VASVLFDHKTTAARLAEFETNFPDIARNFADNDASALDAIHPAQMKIYAIIMLITKSIMVGNASTVGRNFGHMKGLIENVTSIRVLESVAHIVIKEYGAGGSGAGGAGIVRAVVAMTSVSPGTPHG
jgi:hypothetical protein